MRRSALRATLVESHQDANEVKEEVKKALLQSLEIEDAIMHPLRLPSDD
jgi:hypothetical protein